MVDCHEHITSHLLCPFMVLNILECVSELFMFLTGLRLTCIFFTIDS